MTATTEWISVGALGDSFAPANHCLPPVKDMERRTLRLYYEDGGDTSLSFDGGTLEWRCGDEAAQGAACAVTRRRAGILFIDFQDPRTPTSSISLVLNENAGTFIEIAATLPTCEEAMIPMIERARRGLALTAVRSAVRRGTIDRTFSADAPLPQATDELLGKRVEYLYSQHERYEHVYLNSRFYTWRCIEGSEQGLTDTDACQYYKIDEQLYLFVWLEKIVPTAGVVMVDLHALKTTGKIMGYEDMDFAGVRNFGVGAIARVPSTIPAQ